MSENSGGNEEDQQPLETVPLMMEDPNVYIPFLKFLDKLEKEKDGRPLSPDEVAEKYSEWKNEECSEEKMRRWLYKLAVNGMIERFGATSPSGIPNVMLTETGRSAIILGSLYLDLRDYVLVTTRDIDEKLKVTSGNIENLSKRAEGLKREMNRFYNRIIEVMGIFIAVFAFIVAFAGGVKFPEGINAVGVFYYSAAFMIPVLGCLVLAILIIEVILRKLV